MRRQHVNSRMKDKKGYVIKMFEIKRFVLFMNKLMCTVLSLILPFFISWRSLLLGFINDVYCACVPLLGLTFIISGRPGRPGRGL